MNTLIFKSITIQNFKKFYPDCFIFEFDDKNSIHTFENGFGKTTILDALMYVFTNKTLNGTTTGITPINDKNELINAKVKLTLKMLFNNELFTIKLEENIRSVNDIYFKTLKEFHEYIENKFEIKIDELHNLMNPRYTLNNYTTKELRTRFSKIFLKNSNIKTLEEELLTLCSDYNKQYVLEVIEKTRMFEINNVIKTYEINVKKKTEQLKTLEELIQTLKTLNDSILTSNEEEQLQNLKIKKQKIQEIERNLQDLKNNLFIIEKNICHYCKQPINNENLIKENEKRKEKIAELITLLNKEKEDFDEEHFEKLKKQSLNNESKTKIKEFENTKQNLITEIETENEKLNISLIYQKQIMLFLEQKLKESFHFDVKLYHKNKTENTYTETFSLLDDGVDFKFLNTAKQIFIGLKIIPFFTEKTYLPILIDNAESLDKKTLNTILNTTPNNQIICFNVKQDE